MHWGRQCAGFNELPDAGPGDALKGALPSLGRGVNAFFCVVSCWQSVKNCEGLLNCAVFNALGAAMCRRQ